MDWFTALRSRLAAILEPNSKGPATSVEESDPSNDVQRLVNRALALARDDRVDVEALAELANLSRGQRWIVFEAEAACLARDDDFQLRGRAAYLLERSLYDDASVVSRPPTIAERVKVAFADKSTASYADQYLQALQSRIRESSNIIRRMALLALLGLGAFELLSRAAITDVQIGPFRISDLALIQKTLPIILVYLLYEILKRTEVAGYSNRA